MPKSHRKSKQLQRVITPHVKQEFEQIYTAENYQKLLKDYRELYEQINKQKRLQMQLQSLQQQLKNQHQNYSNLMELDNISVQQSERQMKQILLSDFKEYDQPLRKLQKENQQLNQAISHYDQFLGLQGQEINQFEQLEKVTKEVKFSIGDPTNQANYQGKFVVNGDNVVVIPIVQNKDTLRFNKQFSFKSELFASEISKMFIQLEE